MFRYRIFLLFFAVPLCLLSRTFTVSDVLSLRFITESSISPDGKKVLFVVRSASWEKDRFVKTVYMWDGKVKRVGEGVSPAWSKNGELFAYASGRFVVLSDGRRFQLPGAVKDVSFAEVGGIVALVKVGKNRDLFYLDLVRSSVKRLTKGFWINGFSVSGELIAFSSQPGPSPQKIFRSRVYLYRIKDGILKPLTGVCYASSPVISDDGRAVAFITRDGVKDWLANMYIKVVYTNGDCRSYKSLDRHVFKIYRWIGDNVYLLVGDSFYYRLYSLNLRTGIYSCLTKGKGVFSDFSFSKDGSFWSFTFENSTEPEELYLKRGDRTVKLTSLNAHLKGLELGKTKVVKWRVGGLEEEGLFVEPVGRSHSSPLVVFLHGGPASCFKDRFSIGRAYFPSQVLAGKGFAVFMPNPRGSSGYGESFRRALYRSWGTVDVTDVIAGLSKLKGVDKRTVFTVGWSYGGYLALMLGAKLRSVKKIVVGGAISDLYSLYGTTDVPDWMDSFFGKDPYRDPWIYISLSPTYHASKIKAPVLVMHGVMDKRVPFSQALELSRALERFGVDVKLVPFKGEGHVFSRPSSRKRCMEESLRFLEE